MALLRFLSGLNRYRIKQPNEIHLPSCPLGPEPREVILIICGFGPDKYKQSTQRLCSQAKNIGVFSRILAFNKLSDVPGLDAGKLEAIEALAKTHPRGWGLWSWKPAVLKAVMDRAPEGAEIFYIDSGCEISPYGRDIFIALRGLLQQHGYLFFSIPFRESDWTAMHVLLKYGIPVDDQTNQIQATWFGVINTPEWREFMAFWETGCLQNRGELLVEQRYERHLRNYRLIEHREDQSILSCLIKSRSVKSVLLSHLDHFHPDLYYRNSWILLIPVHTSRLSSGFSKIDSLVNTSTVGGCFIDLIDSNKLKVSRRSAIGLFIKDAVGFARRLMRRRFAFPTRPSGSTDVLTDAEP